MLANANTFTLGPNVFKSGGAANVALQAQGNNSPAQTADLFQLLSGGGTPLTAFDKDGYGLSMPVGFALAVGTAATTGTNKTPVIIMPRAGKIVKCFIRAKTGPAGADLICDVNLNGTSIWASTQANRIKIADGGSAGTQASFDTAAFAEGDYFTVDVDQVGSGTPGQDVTVVLYCVGKNQ